ncbi:MAG: hypothetical protein KJO07_19250 [Deltaproteobacteria bacterium]|nr:hypothetical protein [Deltaproteobacteria bacterium]
MKSTRPHRALCTKGVERPWDRRWQSSRVGIVRLVLVSALCLGACKSSDEKQKDLVKPVDGLQAVPAQVSTVIAADVSSLAKQPLVRRAVGEMLHRDPELSKRVHDLAKECKLEPGKDITGVVVAMGEPTGASLLVVQGNFDEANLAACVGKSMASSGGELTREAAGERVVYSAVGTAGQKPVYFSLGSDKTLVASSSRDMLREALGSGPKIAANRRMGELLQRARKDSSLWAVGLVPDAVGKGLVGKAGVKKPPQAMVLAASLGDGLKLELAVEMVDDDDAKAATSLAKPQLAAASLVAQKDGLGTVISRIEVAAESRWVVMSLELDKAELGEILARVQRTVDRSPPPQQNPPSKESPPSGEQE